MGVFDGILDDIVDLGDWVGDALGGKNVLDTAFRGWNLIQSNQKEKQKAAFSTTGYNMNSGVVGTQGNDARPGKANYGLENFAPDAAAIEAMWYNRLQQLVQTKQTMVGRK